MHFCQTSGRKHFPGSSAMWSTGPTHSAIVGMVADHVN